MNRLFPLLWSASPTPETRSAPQPPKPSPSSASARAEPFSKACAPARRTSVQQPSTASYSSRHVKLSPPCSTASETATAVSWRPPLSVSPTSAKTPSNPLPLCWPSAMTASGPTPHTPWLSSGSQPPPPWRSGFARVPPRCELRLLSRSGKCATAHPRQPSPNSPKTATTPSDLLPSVPSA